MATEPEPLALPASPKINPWYRAASVVLGLAGLGSGGAAVFLTHVEAGPVALLAVGLLLLLIGMAGRLPSRIKIGDNEAAWDAVLHFVTRVAEETPEDAKPELLDALTDLAHSAPQAASAGVGAVAYEQLVLSMLHSAVSTIARQEQKVISFAAQTSDRAYDAILTGNGRVVGVEIKALSAELTGRTIAQIERQVMQAAASSTAGITAWLLVTRSPLNSSAQAWLHENTSDIYVVRVRGVTDSAQLAMAVREALGLNADSNNRYFAARWNA